jgi:bla regulator protein blaR1
MNPYYVDPFVSHTKVAVEWTGRSEILIISKNVLGEEGPVATRAVTRTMVGFAFVYGGILAQTPATDTSRTTFEVASVRPSKPGNIGGISVRFLPSGLYTASNMPLGLLIRNAYGIRLPLQLVDAPDWIESARFDISAKAAVNQPSRELQQLLLQSLLTERFKLRVHRETRELPIYALVTARKDGQFGPQLRRAKVAADCRSLSPAQSTPASSPFIPCGMKYSDRSQSVANMPLGALIENLPPLNRVVIDRTGLSGRFDWHLLWESDPNATTDTPSIYTALQEQLGLKLDTQRGPVEVVVVDHVERPTPD